MTPEEEKIAKRREYAREYHQRYRLAHPEKLAERKRRYRLANKEKVSAYEKEYSRAHAEEKKEYRRKRRVATAERRKKYRLANKEKLNKQQRQYTLLHKAQVREINQRYRERNRAVVLKRLRNCALKRNYSITLDDYNALLEAQDGKCAICGGTNNGRTLHVDHDHKTGKVRGLLCGGCNSAIADLKDDPIRIQKALDYIVVHSRVENDQSSHLP